MGPGGRLCLEVSPTTTHHGSTQPPVVEWVPFGHWRELRSSLHLAGEESCPERVNGK